MIRKVSFALAALLLLLPLAIFSVQAVQDDVADVVSYLYDPDYEGETPKGGTLSFAPEAKNYLRRYATLSWDPNVISVSVVCKTKNVEVEIGQGSCYIWVAGEYTITTRGVLDNSIKTCTVTMMPVVQMSGEHLAVNNSTGKFWRTAYNYFPTIVCENVDRIELDRSDISTGTNAAEFLEAREKSLFGEHVLKFVSGTYATSVYIDIHACLVTKTYDEELGKNCLLISVGDFGEGFSVYLDGVTLLSPGEHKITAVGQHTISAKQTKGGTTQNVSNVSPAPAQLKLQVQLLLDDLSLEEPITLQLSRWDATFYVNGKQIEGDYRVAASGKNVITAFDKNGQQIEGAFLLKTVGSDVGTEYTELVLEFSNPHTTYAILMMIPAALMIAAAVFFFLRRRRIV